MHGSSAARPAHLQLTRFVATLAMLFGLLASAHNAAAQQAAPPRFEDVGAQPQEPQHIQAVEHSDAYYTRLTIHRYASYLEFPLFGAQYYLGDKLLNGDGGSSVKSAHSLVAGGLGALFAVNTVTGVWNLVEARKDPHSARRIIHSLLMLGADAGFAYTGLVSAEDARDRGEDARTHRNAALISMGSAAAGTLLMWLWKDPD